MAFIIQEFTPPSELPFGVTAILGVLAPVVIQWVKNKIGAEKDLTRLAIAVLFSAVIGAISWLMLKPEGIEIDDSIAWVFALSTIAFKAFWQPIWKNKENL